MVTSLSASGSLCIVLYISTLLGTPAVPKTPSQEAPHARTPARLGSSQSPATVARSGAPAAKLRRTRHEGGRAVGWGSRDDDQRRSEVVVIQTRRWP